MNDSNNYIYNAVVELKLGNSTLYSTTTSQNGSYTLNDVNESNYTLSVTKSGFEVYTTVVEVLANSSSEENVTLTASANSGRIIGSVWNSTFNKVDSADVYVYETGTSNLVQVVKSDSNGDYIVNGLVTSTGYDLNATKLPTYPTTVAGQTNVILAPGGTSSGNDIVVGSI